jgi:tetratricopeptide (TPR) repeat protein
LCVGGTRESTPHRSLPTIATPRAVAARPRLVVASPHCRTAGKEAVESDDVDRHGKIVLAKNAAALGDVARTAGRPEEAMRCYRESLAIMLSVVGDDGSAAMPLGKRVALLVKLGDMERRCGQTVAARSHYLAATAELRRCVDEDAMQWARRRLAACLKRLGNLAKAGCDYPTARDCYVEALAVMRADLAGQAVADACVALPKWLRLAATAEHAVQSHADALMLYRELAACYQRAHTDHDALHAIRDRVRCCWRVAVCLDSLERHTEAFEATSDSLPDVSRLEAKSQDEPTALRTCRAFWAARRVAAKAVGRLKEAAIASQHACRLRVRIAPRTGRE